MQRIQKQLNFQNRKISQFENDKKQMEIDHLKALLAVKQGSDVGSMNSLNRVPDRTREVGHFLNFFSLMHRCYSLRPITGLKLSVWSSFNF